MNLLNRLDHITNIAVYKSILKTKNILDSHKKVLVSISGGSDSDILIDLVERNKSATNEVEYVFYDTGIEYKATKRHLDYLESKYRVSIKKIKALKPVPVACREYGQPFLSKFISEMMERLQSHRFQWEDEEFEVLLEKYPKCKAALRWWTNEFGEDSAFNIARNKYLKDYIIQNPPRFKISNKCCKYSKKKVVENYLLDGQFNLNIFGVRKSEGGIRSTSYKSCYSETEKFHNYLPILHFTNDDKNYYNQFYEIINSDCYTKYGLKRTGCVGCPYGANWEEELIIVEKYEPQLATAVKNVFRNSYDYQRNYIKYIAERKCQEEIKRIGYEQLSFVV